MAFSEDFIPKKLGNLTTNVVPIGNSINDIDFAVSTDVASSYRRNVEGEKARQADINNAIQLTSGIKSELSGKGYKLGDVEVTDVGGGSKNITRASFPVRLSQEAEANTFKAAVAAAYEKTVSEQGIQDNSVSAPVAAQAR